MQRNDVVTFDVSVTAFTIGLRNVEAAGLAREFATAGKHGADLPRA
jgi:hypothetical protein